MFFCVDLGSRNSSDLARTEGVLKEVNPQVKVNPQVIDRCLVFFQDPNSTSGCSSALETLGLDGDADGEETMEMGRSCFLSRNPMGLVCVYVFVMTLQIFRQQRMWVGRFQVVH